MPSLHHIRADKPPTYPDQAVYAEFAARSFGLAFNPLDNGSGLAFGVASKTRQIVFGGGRASYYPQNNATAATLAADKYLSAVVLTNAGIPTMGGQYFFLSERYRAHRADGHERNDAIAHFHSIGGHAFVKPLAGSRGDFAQAVHDEDALRRYLDDVARYYDAIIMQNIVEGDEYRVFVMDDCVLYSTRKYPPYVIGDGVSSRHTLLTARNADFLAYGLSNAVATGDLNAVPAEGERWSLPGRMNRSAGGEMIFDEPPKGVSAMAIAAVRALGLRVGGVDVFTGVKDELSTRVIEINANPSIRFLEDSDRDDLILAIWRHTFTAMGLLDVQR